MHDEQLLELLEKMLDDIKSGILVMDRNLREMGSRIEKLEDSQLRLENEIENSKKTLYDAYIQNAEAIKGLDERVQELSEKVDKHAIKIQVIEGGKKAL
jgi:predicted  nucleic acid-binding Zn-ribbon protein